MYQFFCGVLCFVFIICNFEKALCKLRFCLMGHKWSHKYIHHFSHLRCINYFILFYKLNNRFSRFFSARFARRPLLSSFHRLVPTSLKYICHNFRRANSSLIHNHMHGQCLPCNFPYFPSSPGG